jgi:dephospho-CoA kinase
MRPFVIGLTGPIGCGKSTVGRMLAELGGTVVDADALARRATRPRAATLPAIRGRFGDAVFGPDGSLDRAALAAVVFADGGALADLERIVHPEVRTLVVAALDDAERAGAPFVVVEAIKLVEGGLAARCDEVWLVECSPVEQRDRLLGRGMSRDDADRRMAAQGPDMIERLAASASRRIPTDGDVEATRERVEDALADALEPLLLDT